MALLLTLIGSCEAYTLLSVPRAAVAYRSSGASMDTTDFRFGCGKKMASTVVGFQGGAGKGMGITEEVNPVKKTDSPDFRFGAARAAIGFQGGAGKGMGFATEANPVKKADSPDFRFGPGSGMRASVIGFQGGAGKGMGVEQDLINKAEKSDSTLDDFRFSSGNGMSPLVIGFQGGKGKGMGMVAKGESAPVLEAAPAAVDMEPEEAKAEEEAAELLEVAA